METIDVVRKLIGPITPVGETYADGDRYVNMLFMCALVRDLLRDIREVSKYKDRSEHSMNKAGDYAHSFIKGIGDEFE